jgi:prophage regulatory protein
MQRRRPYSSRELRSQPMADLFDKVRPAPVKKANPIDDEIWNVRTITAKTGISRSTLYKYVKDGHFPRQRKLGPRRVGWLASDVRSWMAGLEAPSQPSNDSTAAPDGDCGQIKRL